MIEFDQVYKRYDGEAVVEDFSLEVNEGEFFVLIGPSGSGKTTTLKMINKLIELSEGYITIEGKMISEYDLQELRWNIGYVLQQIGLFPNMTVEENILVVPEMLNWSEEKKADRVTELLESVNMEPEKYRHREVADLSGGEQQRIGVIRALAADPDIILMDEPFSALDPITRNSLQEDVMDLQKKFKKTIVFVTHDMQEAINLGDRICLMNEGRIEQIGTPDEILNHPANDFVKELLHTGLPHYEEEQTVEQLIDKGYTINSYEDASELERLSPESSLHELTVALSDHLAVQIEGKDSQFITRKQLLQYYTEKTDERQEVEA